MKACSAQLFYPKPPWERRLEISRELRERKLDGAVWYLHDKFHSRKKFTDEDRELICKLGQPEGYLQGIKPSDKMSHRKGLSPSSEHDFEYICGLGSEHMIMCYWANSMGDSLLSPPQMVAACRNCQYCLCDLNSSKTDFENSLAEQNSKENAAHIIIQTILELHKKIELSKPKSFVYFISDGEYMKIGKADNPFKRIGGIQTGNPRPCSIQMVIPFQSATDAAYAEGVFHKRLQCYAMCGEWFDICCQATYAAIERQGWFAPCVYADMCGDSSCPTKYDVPCQAKIKNRFVR